MVTGVRVARNRLEPIGGREVGKKSRKLGRHNLLRAVSTS